MDITPGSVLYLSRGYTQLVGYHNPMDDIAHAQLAFRMLTFLNNCVNINRVKSPTIRQFVQQLTSNVRNMKIPHYYDGGYHDMSVTDKPYETSTALARP